MITIIIDYLKRIRQKVIESKVYVQRVMGYVSIIQMLGIVYLVMANLQERGFEFNMFWFIPVTFILLIGLILGGYIEDKLGYWEEELDMTYKRIPQFTELLKEVKEIKEMIKIGGKR